MVVVLVALSSVGALRASGPTSRPTRRQAFQRYVLPGLGAALMAPLPRAAVATCSCPTGLDSCVCTGENADPMKGALGPKRRADAAGRDLVDTLNEKRAMDEYFALQEDPKKLKEAVRAAEKRAADQQAARQRVAEAPPPPGSDIQVVSSLGLTGGGSQDVDGSDTSGAKARFREVVMQTVRKREAEYGFELDAADIRQIEDALRPKYCGKEGLIGAC